MPIVGTRTLKVSKIVLPGDFKVRTKAPHVAELAESVKAHGLLHPPTVERKTLRLVAGHDRVAALLAAGVKEITVNLADGDERELRRLTVTENLHRRRDDVVQLRREYAGEVEQEIAEERAAAPRNNGDTVPKKGPGRPKTPKGEARERVAREAGVTPAALKKADQRARREVHDEGPDQAHAAPLPPPIRTFGLELPQTLAADVTAVQKGLDATDQYLRQAQAELTRLAKAHGDAIAHARLQKLQREVHAAAAAVRGSRPEMACPFCKLVPELLEVCNGCGGLGYLAGDQAEGVPRELMDEQALLVAVHGKFVPRAEGAAAWKAAPIPGRRQRKIRVEDEDGRDLNTDEAANEEELGF